MERHAVVAGSFYPGSAGEITKMLEGFIDRGAEKRGCAAVVVPHAGYIYSGRVAGATYSVALSRRGVAYAAWPRAG